MKTLLLYIYLNDFSEVPSIIIGLGCEHTHKRRRWWTSRYQFTLSVCVLYALAILLSYVHDTGYSLKVRGSPIRLRHHQSNHKGSHCCTRNLSRFWMNPWFLSWRQNIYGDDEICIISDLNGEITKAQLVQEVALQFCNWYKAGGRGKEAAQKSNFKINRHKSIEIRINYYI